jgi:hypothetical protein
MTRRSLFDIPTEITRLGPYRPVKRLPELCSRSGDFTTGASSMTGTGIPSGFCVDHTTHRVRGKTLYPESFGQLFPRGDFRDQYLYERGFLVAYYARPCCWFGLRLPPAARRYIERTGNFELIPKMLGDKLCSDWDIRRGACPIHTHRRPAQ